MQQVKQQQKEEGFDTAKDYDDNFPSLGGDLGGTEEFDENDEQYEDVDGDECEEIIIDEDDDKTIQAFTGGGVRNVFLPVHASNVCPPVCPHVKLEISRVHLRMPTYVRWTR